MKTLLAALFFIAPSLAFAADGPVALGSNNGAFGDWTAATYGSGAAKICYAFTVAQTSKPEIKKRGQVMLTVTERVGTRDEVTLSAGYTYPPSAQVTLTIGTTPISFYTQGGTAFTTSGAQAISAFRGGAAAEAVSTGPHGHPVTDDFSLKGFSGAYSAIAAACP
jgi:invasion protein IalB